MLKIEQLTQAIQIRNHLKMLSESNVFPNASKERLRDAKELIRKIDNWVIESSSDAWREMEKLHEPQKENRENKIESNQTVEVSVPAVKILPLIREAPKNTSLVPAPIKEPEKIVEIEKVKKISKAKQKKEVLEIEAKLEPVAEQNFTVPQTLSEVQSSGRRGFFRRKQ